MLIPLSASSQIISTQRVTKTVNASGDTLISFLLSDAKIILADLQVKELNDSIISIYEIRLSIKDSILDLNTFEITLLETKVSNLENINFNQSLLLDNKDFELSISEDIIVQQNRSIRRLKVTKYVLIGIITISPLTLLMLR